MAIEIELFNQSYSEETLCDVERDVSESFSSVYNPKAKDIPEGAEGYAVGEFIVTVTYREA